MRVRRIRTHEFALAIAIAIVLSFTLGTAFERSCPAPAEQKAEGANPAEGAANLIPTADRAATRTGSNVKPAEFHAAEGSANAPQNQNCSPYRALANWLLEIKLSDVLLIFFTAVLAYKTAGLYRATVGLQRGAIRQDRSTRKALKQSADTAERQLRAYVLIEKAQFEYGPSGKVYINLIVKNFGQTPATGTIKTETDFSFEKLPDFVIPLTEKAETHPGAIIGPGHIQTISIDRSAEVVGAGPWGTLKRAGKVAYVWGRIDYIDAFGACRHTSFQMFNPFGDALSFGASKVGNEIS